MRNLRAGWLVLSTAFNADPRRTILTMLLEGFGQLGTIMSGVWLKLVTDGVISQNGTPVLIGAVGLSTSYAIGLASGGFGTRLRLTLAERTAFAFEKRYAEVSASVSTLTHHEHPEFRDKLEILQNNRMSLGQTTHALLSLASLLFLAFSTFVLIASLHPLLLLLPIFGIPSGIVAAYGQRWSRQAEEITAPSLRRARHLYETGQSPGAAKELRVFGIEQQVSDRHADAWMIAHRKSMSVRWKQSILGSLAYAFFGIGFVGAVVFIALRAVEGLATAGDVVMAITVAGQVNQLVSQGVGQFAWIGQTLRNARRFRWLLDHVEIEQKNAPTGAAPTRLDDGISFANVTFSYPGTEKEILRDISVRLPAGSVVALVGENGAGKTTFVKLLCRFYEPTTGRIVADGIEVGSIAVDSWRQQMTGGFQDFAKLEFIVQQSVGVGDLPKLDDEPAVVGALDRSGGSDVLATLTEGLTTQLGRTWAEGAELSGGQWQKLALGRALMRERPLLTIFDEPTASLDAETEHLLFERYAAEARTRREDGAITVLVSHRFSTVRSADLIVVLDGGTVTEVGTHTELMAKAGLYAELYSIQAKGYR
jgi:ATP-binding cassette subfamily B protein